MLHSHLPITRGLPALTIHTVVRQAGKAFKNVKNPRLQAWGPTMTGLAVIPGLPFLFDHPVEHVTDRAFNWIRQQIGTRYTAEKRAIDK
jgi:fission process protein 1